MNWSKRRVLLTGGAGFLGSAIGSQLRSIGAYTVVLDDLSTGSKKNLENFADEFVLGKVDHASLSKLHGMDFDFVLHFGSASSSILFDSTPTVLEDTVEGMREILGFCREEQVKQLVFPSSSSVYGNSKLPQTEEGTTTLPVNSYGVGKLSCEHLARIYSDYVKSIGLRIFAGYGPGEMKKVGFWSIIGAFLNDFKSNTRPILFGDGTQSRDFVYVDDIVNVLQRVIETGYAGIMNVGSGDSYRFLEVLDTVSRILGTKLEPKFLPKPKMYFEHTWADISRMRSITGIEPKNLEHGIRDYIEDVGEYDLVSPKARTQQ